MLKKVLFVPDTHRPYHDKAAWSLLLKVAKDFKPHTIVVLGDFADFYTVSAHSKDPDRALKLKEELDDVHVGIKELESLGASELIFIAGNHEDRLHRYMQNKAPEIAHLVDIKKILKLHNWKYIPYKTDYQLGKIYLTHDVGSAGRTAIFRCLDAYQHSNITGHCLPLEYKVATPTGFVGLADIKVGDAVLAYENGRVVTTKVNEKVQYSYTGDMAKFDNNAISMEMTSKHHIYTRNGEYVPVLEALKTKTKSDLVSEALPMIADEFEVSDSLLRLVVAFCADGSMHFEAKKGVPQIRFHFKKQRKVDRLTKLISDAGYMIEWTKSSTYKSKKISKELRIQLMELVPDKVLPNWFLNLSERQRQIVLDELVFWDGSIIKDNGVDYGSRQFCSHKPEEVSLVQTLLTQHGIRSTLVSDKTVVRYNVFPKYLNSKTKLKKYVEWLPVTDKKVGCITTAQQNFFIQTDKGNTELSGNTHRLSYVVEADAAGEPKLAAQFGWLGDVEAADYMHRMKARKDWALGFGIGYLDTQSKMLYATPVPIIKHTCVVEGKLYKGGKK